MPAPTPWPGAAPAAERNPYQAPRARVERSADDLAHGSVLARRFTRLAAAILDNLILVVPFVVLLFALGAMETASDAEELMMLGALAMGLVAVPVLLINLYLLAQSGQTMGKKALRIRIVRYDGSHAGLGRIIFLRYLAPGALGSIPYLGYLFGLLNLLFIFGEERRCIHDYFADTKVVLA